jgi:hypothetical protein
MNNAIAPGISGKTMKKTLKWSVASTCSAEKKTALPVTVTGRGTRRARFILLRVC